MSCKLSSLKILHSTLSVNNPALYQLWTCIYILFVKDDFPKRILKYAEVNFLTDKVFLLA